MRISGWVSLSSVVLISTACLAPDDQPDGASCTTSNDCNSGRCNEGFCGGRTCKPSDPGACDSGWKCDHIAADPISSVFGAEGSELCRPLCGRCPGNAYCPEGGKDGETFCTIGKAPLSLSIEAANVVVGQPARLVATAGSPTGRLVSCEWSLGDNNPPHASEGPELSHVFEKAGTYHVRVTCTDDGGREGSGERDVDVAM